MEKSSHTFRILINRGNMKTLYILILVLFFMALDKDVMATDLNGRIFVLNNDGNNFKVLFQISTDSGDRKLGGASIVIDFDTTLLSIRDEPRTGIDFIFNDFHMVPYDTAKVTKVSGHQLWINIDLEIDSLGTFISGAPFWTDLVIINFVSNGIVPPTHSVFWSIHNKYWQVYDSDNFSSWELGNFDYVSPFTAVENLENDITSFKVNQNYPNPFNPSTTISYSIPASSFVALKVYDILGNEIATLVDAKKPVGSYEVKFDAVSLTSGIYFYRLQAGDFVETKKMVLLR